MEHYKSLILRFELTAGYGIETILFYLTALSLFTFILSLVLLPYLIRKIPSDYFLKLSESPPKAINFDITRLFILLTRNILGCFLLVSGVVMLFLPGQGLITIFISLLLLDFPWKRKLIIRFISNKKIQSTINWIRHKSNRRPVDWPPDS